MTIEVTLSKDAFAELLATDKKLAEEYTADEKNEGAYILSTAIGYESPEAIHGLKQALDRERHNARDGNANGKKAEALETELAELKAKGANTDTLAGQVSALQTQLADLTGTLATERTQRHISDAAAANKGNLALREYLQRRVKTDPTTGKAFAVDPDSGEAILAADGKNMSVNDYVKHLREQADTKGSELGALFLGNQSSGGGTPPGGGGGGGHKPAPGTLRRSTMTPRQKVDFIRENSDAAYQQLKF